MICSSATNVVNGHCLCWNDNVPITVGNAEGTAECDRSEIDLSSDLGYDYNIER